MIIPAIKHRRSIRSYKPDAVSKDQIIELVKAGQYAPSAKNNRAVEYVIITDQAIKNKLYQILGQSFLKQAPVIIIPVTDITKTHYPVQDLSVVAENIFLQAAELGLGTVWKNVSPDFVDDVKRIINLPENYTLINVIPVGYPAESVSPHSDKDFAAEKIHFNQW